MAAFPSQQRQVGQSHALGHGGSEVTFAKNSDLRRALAASVTRAALERARAEREASLSGFEQRQKAAVRMGTTKAGEGCPETVKEEAREGLNQLGLASFPKQEEKGWGWCMPARQIPDIAGLRKSPSTVPVQPRANGEVIRGLCRAESYSSCPEGEEPIFGEARAYGDVNWDGRMRGGELARNGWAGTFPLTNQRG
ncbi:unnamed protein product [Durusdinium trenchii]|uniref:Uncharacterized protein n=1 Tax=Durusdinium trenchii TaxID=1381693 RepID=A0ABP0JTD9_9DINO